MGPVRRRRAVAHPARKTHPERVHRALQSHLPCESPRSLRVHRAHGRTSYDRRLAAPLQLRSSAPIVPRPLCHGIIGHLYFQVTRRYENASVCLKLIQTNALARVPRGSQRFVELIFRASHHDSPLRHRRFGDIYAASQTSG